VYTIILDTVFPLRPRLGISKVVFVAGWF